MTHNVLGMSCYKLIASVDRLIKCVLADYCSPSPLTVSMLYQMIPLLAFRPPTQFNDECHRELRKLEHVCKAELGGDVYTATTLM
jgi:hypothetical protein